MRVIGITGTNGAGKGTIVDYLVSKKGFVHYSVREFLVEKIRERGLEVNRTNMVRVANELRSAHHPAYIVEQLYDRAVMGGADCVIESIRTPGEVMHLSENARFHLFAIDADPEIRYGRISARNNETDKVTFREFLSEERREMASADPNSQNIAKCMQMAEYCFLNNGTIPELQKKIEDTLNEIK